MKLMSVAQRLEQLNARGSSALLIRCLASEAQGCASMRSTLRNQTSSAHNFVSEYCRAYDENKGEATMRAAIDGFADEVYEQIGRLDQTVKDLLQFVSTGGWWVKGEEGDG
jgi:hypothetical protein